MSGWMKLLGITALVIVIILSASLWSDWRSAQAAADGAGSRQLELENIAARLAADASVIGVTITEDSPGKFSLQVERQELPTPIHEAHYDGVDPRVVEELKHEVAELRQREATVVQQKEESESATPSHVEVAGVPASNAAVPKEDEVQVVNELPPDPPQVISVLAAFSPTGEYSGTSRSLMIQGSYILVVDWTEQSGGYALYRYHPATDDYHLESWPLSPDVARSYNARPDVSGIVPPQTTALTPGTLARLMSARPPDRITQAILDKNEWVEWGKFWEIRSDGIRGALYRLENGASAWLRWKDGRERTAAFYRWNAAENSFQLDEYPLEMRFTGFGTDPILSRN